MNTCGHRCDTHCGARCDLANKPCNHQAPCDLAREDEESRVCGNCTWFCEAENWCDKLNITVSEGDTGCESLERKS